MFIAKEYYGNGSRILAWKQRDARPAGFMHSMP
jgi:hypothetical protein